MLRHSGPHSNRCHNCRGCSKLEARVDCGRGLTLLQLHAHNNRFQLEDWNRDNAITSPSREPPCLLSRTRPATSRLTRRPSPLSIVEVPSRSTFSTGRISRILRTGISSSIPMQLRRSPCRSFTQTLTSLSALQAKQLELERQQHTDSLRKHLEKRPEKEELVESTSY